MECRERGIFNFQSRKSCPLRYRVEELNLNGAMEEELEMYIVIRRLLSMRKLRFVQPFSLCSGKLCINLYQSHLNLLVLRPYSLSFLLCSIYNPPFPLSDLLQHRFKKLNSSLIFEYKCPSYFQLLLDPPSLYSESQHAADVSGCGHFLVVVALYFLNSINSTASSKSAVSQSQHRI
jgi:hypothetical protein